MRPQARRHNVQEASSPRTEASNLPYQLEDSETSKMTVKKVSNTINLSDGLPMHATVEQLKMILAQPALSIGDKAVLLDARDRLIRLRKDAKEKTSGSSKSTTLIGTCLDMCPEKERYSRAEKRRLASYELLISYEKDYEVNHNLAVKEYSRSSADQAEPLSHELRPLPVLQMTMNYLIAKIVDCCNLPGENLADWFNFLWDRMRGIRKDITQQSLCDLGSVDLVEKCARFHIHCTARLCELDMQDFDQKINDENLTKCLQTLKHMYYDLSLKNIFCPNEAEFRSYDVLLHLNDGEILREVLQLRAEVRDSHEVRSALEFVNSLNSRNYVRFFKLAESNQYYLQCCLLQRYFSQIRRQALQIMVQAYGPPKKGQMHLSSLVKLLGYKDVEEVSLLCECHGLPFDSFKQVVKFDRSCFLDNPVKVPPMRRSSLIENKRKSSVSEIIAKRRVPEDPTLHHEPLNSFDEAGYLRREAWYTEEQVELLKIFPSTVNLSADGSNITTVSSTFIESLSVRVQNELINSTVKKFLVEICTQVVSDELLVNKTAFVLAEEFISDWILEMANNIVSELNLVKRHEEKRKLNAQRKFHMFSNQILDEVVDSFIEDQVRNLVIEAIQVASHLQANVRKDNYALEVLNFLIDSIASTESRAIANVVAKEAIERRENTVLHVSKLVEMHRIRRWIGIWRRFTLLQIRRRKEKQTFPACPTRMDFGEQVASLRSKGENTGACLKRKSLVEQTATVKRFNSLSDLQFNLRKIRISLKEVSFDLFGLLDGLLRPFPHSAPNRIWKLVILAFSCTQEIGDVIRKWFGFVSAQKTENGWIYTETRTTQHTLTLCVRFLTDIRDFSEYLCGANALLVVNEPVSISDYVIENLATAIEGQSKYLPLSVACVSSKPFPCRSERLINTLKPCLNMNINFDNFCSDRQQQLADIFSRLIQASQISKEPKSQICFTTVWELANNFISHKILPTIYRDLKERIKFGLSHQSLSQLIEFNNHAIQHLVESVMFDSELYYVKWPAPELVEMDHLNLPPFNWNSKEYQLQIQLILEKFLILPKWSLEKYELSYMYDALYNYCHQLSVPGIDPTAFFSRVSSILEQSNTLYFEKNKENKMSIEHLVSWTDIFQACVDYRIQGLIKESQYMLTGYFSRTLNAECHSIWIEARHALQLKGQSSSGIECTQLLELENFDSRLSEQSTKSLDLPYSVANLCDAISYASSESHKENQNFEELMLRVLTPEKQSIRRSPSKHSDIPMVTVKDHLVMLERKLEQSRLENHKFESFLKRALEKK